MGYRRSLDFLPKYFKTEKNSKFLNATLDQLISEPELKKLDGFVGRKFAPSYKSTDGYLDEIDATRQNYQLEPSTIYKDEDGKVKLVSTYIDMINRINSLGGITDDHSRLFASKQYSYDGQFDFDKFVNFSSYYWLPNGPDAVDIYSVPLPTEEVFTVTPPRIYQVVSGEFEREPFDTTNFDVSPNPIARLRNDGFKFSGYEGLTNPPLRLARGGTYAFNLDQIGHGFFIQTQPGLTLNEPWQQNLSVRDVYGVTNNGNDVGYVMFNVPQKNAQDFYVSMPNEGSANLVASSSKKNRPLRYVEVQYQSADTLNQVHSGLDGQRFIHGKTIVFLPDPALTSIPVAWQAYTSYDEGDLIRYGNDVYRAITSFTTGRIFNPTNLELFDPTDDWYDPSPFDSDDFPFDSTNFDRGAEVSEEKRTGRFSVSVGTDGIIKLTPAQVIDLNSKIDILEGIKYGNRQVMHLASDTLEIMPNITANLDFLYYQDSLDPSIHGTIELVDQADLVPINVGKDILGLETYVSPNGITFTNGLKVKFRDNTVPETFGANEYYVEGVGDAITLIPVAELVTPEPWLDSLHTPFDTSLFDDGPFDAQTSAPLAKDYIVANRASRDRNAWARTNRWFHQDVITATAAYNNYAPNLDFTSRANRPIIEIRPDLQLFNFGKNGKLPVDLIDTVTLDAFSNVEGVTVEEVEGRINSYDVDAVPLTDGLRIIFAADQDDSVRNKVYKVKWIRPQSSADERIAVFTGDGSTMQFDLNFDVTSTLNLDVQIDGVNANKAGFIWSIVDSQLLTFNEATIPHFGSNITATLVYKEQIHLELVEDDISQDDTVTILNGLSNQGKQYFFDNGAWKVGQLKTSVNQAPLYDLVDSDGTSLSDTTKYPSNTFTGNKIFGYQIADTGTPDSELGFRLKYRTFNNVGDILFADYINKSSFNYRTGVESVQKSTAGSRIVHNLADGTVEYLNQWVANEFNTQQYQLQTYFATQYQKNLFPLNVVPLDRTEPLDPTSILVYVNNRSINSNLYDIQIEGSQGFLLLDNDLQVGDKLDIKIASAIHNANSVFEIPPALEFNPLNQESEDFTLGQLRAHIVKVYENTPDLRGEFIGLNNSRDLGNYKKFGGQIVQNLGAPHLANLFLNDTQANFVESIIYSQREYTRFKNKFLELLFTLPLTNPTDPVQSVDDVITELSYNKNHMFPFFASDMAAYGTDFKKLSYTIVDPDVVTFDMSSVFNDMLPSSQAILVYLNGKQLIKGLEYQFLPNQPIVKIIVANPSDVLNHSTITLNVNDVVEIREYASTDGSHIPETPTKMGLYPAFRPMIIQDGNDENPRQVLRGHDGSLTALFGDMRDDALLELEKRIFNNLKVTYTGDLQDIRDYLPGGFRKTPYTKQEYDSILSASFNTWLGKNGVRTSDYWTFDPNDLWSYNYHSSTSKVDGNPMPAAYWRGIFKYYFDTDSPSLRPWEMLGFSEEPDWWQFQYGPAPYTRGNQVLWNDLEIGKIAYGDRAGIDARYARPGLINYIPVDESGNMLSPLECIVGNYNLDVTGNFVFGDGGPVETAWRQSSEYPFAMQLALALMNPGEYFGANIDKNLQVLQTFGAGNNQWVYADTGLRHEDVQYVHGETKADGTIARVNGYVTWISEYAKSLGLNITTAVGNKLRNATVQFAYKMAGYTDKKYIRVYAAQATPNSSNPSITIPDEDYDVVLNKSAPLDNITYSGVIVTKTPDGFSVNGYDDNKPYFTIEPSSTTGRTEFVKVGNLAVTKYVDGDGTEKQIPYGTEFTIPEQVVDFLISYGRYLTSKGFLFLDKLDEDSGFYKDWDLAAREFLFYVQQGWDQDVALSISPVGNSLSFRADLGVIDGLTDKVKGTRVLNEDFKILRTSDYEIFRQGRDFRITIDDPSGIYLLDVDLVTYEHVLVFNNTTRFNDVVYDPVLGARQYRLKISGSKTGDWDGSFGAAGFIINDDNIEDYVPGKNYYKGNIVKFKNTYYTAAQDISGDIEFDLQNWIKSDYSKINKGLLPNLANKAGASTKFYNVDEVNLELNADRLGKGLIGLSPRSYLTDLQIGDTSQVKFYQGMITQKGSRQSLDKLLRAKLDNFDGQVDFYEEWAIRAGQYGATESRQEVQLIVDEEKAHRDPSLLEIIDTNDTPADGHVSYRPGDIYVKPRVFNKDFLATRPTNVMPGDLPNAGYARLDDVQWTSQSINTLNSSIDAKLVKQGDEILVATDLDNQWNVFRVDETGAVLKTFGVIANGTATFEFDKAHGLAIDDIILIKTPNNKPNITAFYVVQSVVSSTKITVATGYTAVQQVLVNGVLLKLASQRFSDVANIPAAEPLLGWKVGDKLFVDNATDIGWGVYEKVNAFGNDDIIYPLDPQSITTVPETTANTNFGSSVAVDRATTFMFVGQPGNESVINYTLVGKNLEQDLYITSPTTGTQGFGTKVDVSSSGIGIITAPYSDSGVGFVFVLKTNKVTSKYDIIQVLAPPALGVGGNFGTSVSVSNDGNWLAIGQPNIDGGYVYVYRLIQKPIPPPVTQEFTASGLKTFTLTGTAANPDSVESLLVSVNGVFLSSVGGFTLTGSTVTLTTTPDIGASVSITVTRGDPLQTFIGDGSTKNFDLTGDSATPDNIYNAQIIVDNILYVPYRDYTLTNNIISFVSAPANGAIIKVHQLPFFTLVSGFTSGDNAHGDAFASSVHFSDDGRRLVVGAPKATVNGNSGAGKVYVYDRGLIEVLSDGVTTVYPASVATYSTNVMLNGQLAVEDIGYGGDYTISSGNILFKVAPPIGTLVSIENNVFLETATLVDTTPAPNDAFGSSVFVTTSNKNIYIGAPDANANGKTDVGKVVRFINEAREFGSVTGSVTNPTITANGFLVINDHWVQVSTGQHIATIVTNINNAAIPGVTASSVNNALKLVANPLIALNNLMFSASDAQILTDLGLTPYTQSQVLYGPTNEEYGNFGKVVTLSPDELTLVVGSDKISSTVPTTFDKNATTFDTDATTFTYSSVRSGAAFAYQLFDRPGATLSNPDVFVPAQELINSSIDPLDQYGASIAISQTSIFVGAPGDSTYATHGGAVYSYQSSEFGQVWELTRSEVAKVDHNLINRVSLIDTRQNKIIADLDFIDPFKGKISGVAAEEISYRSSYDPAVYNVDSNGNRILATGVVWGKDQVGQVWWNTSQTRWMEYEQSDLDFRLANWGTAFPQSIVLCYEWTESDVPPSQYADAANPLAFTSNNGYSTSEFIDDSGAIQVKYYFWVASKETVPNMPSRKISTLQIESLISNPKAEGIPYAAFIAPNAIALYNCKQFLRGSDILLSIDYDLTANDNNIHAEYHLIGEGDETSTPTADIITKLIDSLAGSDIDGRLVPDITLTAGRKYGKEFRPRQSMFRNRADALRVAVDYINSKISAYPILQSKDTTRLLASEPIPDETTIEWNEKVLDLTELGYINNIILPIGYRILVESDSDVQNRWTIYELASNDGSLTKFWKLYRVQDYRNTDFIEYIDWVDPTVTLPSVTDFVVDHFYQLNELSVVNGTTVKVKDDGRGLFTIVRYNDVTSEWDTISLEKATVQISEKIWDNVAALQGFDTEGFDLQLFDSWANIEVQNILRAIYEDIFVNELAVEANRWFFMMMQYLLQEQKYVDWIFKTSFIKVLQRQESLQQIVDYQIDNQEFVLDYINEVKPYHTKVREFVLRYDGNELASADATDFDVPAHFIAESGRYRSPNGSETIDSFILDLSAYTPWRDNHTFSIGEIDIVNAGFGYEVAPTLLISGGGGTGATAIAEVLNGQIVRVTVTNGGNGFTTTPTVEILSGSGSSAVLSARLVNNKIRRMSSTIKFDRVSTRYASFLVTFKDGAGNPVDITHEKISRVHGQAGVIDLLLDTVSGGKWIVQSANSIGYPVDVPNFYLFNDTSGRVIVEYQRVPAGLTEFDLEGILRASSGGIHALDLARTEVVVDGSIASFRSIVTEWAANTQYSPGDIVTHRGNAYVAKNRFVTGTVFSNTNVAVEVPANTNEYVFNIGSASTWQPLVEFFPGTYFVDPSNPSFLYRTLQTFVTDVTFSISSFAKMTGDDFESHLDRTWAYYAPGPGQFGRKLSDLFIGIDYPGAKIFGPGFDEEPGYDVAPYDEEPYDRFVIGPEGVKILDPSTLDQTIQSSFTDTELGTRPDDIIVYGGGFIDTYLSHAPEEMIPGSTYDTLEMQVYSTPSDDWTGNGIGYDIVLTTKEYNSGVSTYEFNAPSGTLDSVTVFSVKTGRLLSTNYTCNWLSKTITLNTTLPAGDKLFIYATSESGVGVLFAGQYATNGIQKEWQIPAQRDLIIQTYVLIDGVLTNDYTLTDSSMLVFNTIPAAGHLLTIHALTGDSSETKQLFSSSHNNTFIVDTTNYPEDYTYTLSSDIGYVFPFAEKIIVELNGNRLRPPNQAYYVGDGSTISYQVPTTVHVNPSEIIDAMIVVSVNGVRSQVNVDWIMSINDNSSMPFVLFNVAPAEGDEIVVSLIKDADYQVVDSHTILLNKNVPLHHNDTVFIQWYTNHDLLKIRTQVYKGTSLESVALTVGFDDTPYDSDSFDSDTTVVSTVTRYELSRPVEKTNYLRVTLNQTGDFSGGRYLFPNIDYTMVSPTVIEIGSALGIDPESIIVVTSFYEIGQKPSIGFRIFNDMRGNVSYTRISDNATTTLTQDLNITDTVIHVADASVLGSPDPTHNKPGIVFINGEKITYFTLDVTNNLIKDFRRGVSGTSMFKHFNGEQVVDSGLSQTIPEANNVTWYNTGVGTATNGQGLQNSTTRQATFLLEAPVTPPVLQG